MEEDLRETRGNPRFKRIIGYRKVMLTPKKLGKGKVKEEE